MTGLDELGKSCLALPFPAKAPAQDQSLVDHWTERHPPRCPTTILLQRVFFRDVISRTVGFSINLLMPIELRSRNTATLHHGRTLLEKEQAQNSNVVAAHCVCELEHEFMLAHILILLHLYTLLHITGARESFQF
jgi:hypothetical protein